MTYLPPTLSTYGDLKGLTTHNTRPLTPMTISDLRTRNRANGGTFFQNERSSRNTIRRTFSHVRMAVRYVPDDKFNGERAYIQENGHVFCTSEFHRDEPNDKCIKLWHINLEGEVNYIMSVYSRLSWRENFNIGVHIKRIYMGTTEDILTELKRGNLTAASKLLVKAWAEHNPPVKE